MEFLQQNWYWAALAAVSGAWLMADLIRNRGDKSQLSPVEATMLVNREDAIVIDVREQGEYAQGHIPGSLNIPSYEIEGIQVDKNKPLFVYCLSGARSSGAVSWLRGAGYHAKNIGGIGGYRGEME